MSSSGTPHNTARNSSGRCVIAAPDKLLVDFGLRRAHGAEAGLDALGPAQVLARGYTLTLAEDGKAVRSVAQLPAGAVLETVLSDGRVRSRVESEGAQEDPRLAPTKPARRRKRGANRTRDDGPGLFE